MAEPGRRPEQGGGRRLVTRTASLGGGRIVAGAISGVWMVVAARLLEPAAFGDLAVLLAVSSIAAVAADLGFPFVLADRVAQSGRLAEATLRSIIRRRAVVGALAGLLGGVAYLAVAEDRAPLIPVLLGVSLLATVVHSSIAGGLRGLGIFGFEAADVVASRVLVLAAGWAALAAGGGVVAAAAVYAVADLCSVAWLLVVIRSRLSDEDGIDPASIGWRRTWGLSAGRLLSALYNRADTWLMAVLRSSTDAALYAAPYRILDALVLLPRAAAAVALTHAREAERSGERTFSVRTMALVAGALTVVVVVPLALFADPITTLLFGEGYEAAGPVLAVLLLSAVPGSVVTVLVPTAGVRRGPAFARLMVGAVVVSTAANLVVIPIHGPLGAAWVTLASQVVLALVMLATFDDHPRGADAAALTGRAGPPPGS